MTGPIYKNHQRHVLSKSSLVSSRPVMSQLGVAQCLDDETTGSLGWLERMLAKRFALHVPSGKKPHLSERMQEENITRSFNSFSSDFNQFSKSLSRIGDGLAK